MTNLKVTNTNNEGMKLDMMEGFTLTDNKEQAYIFNSIEQLEELIYNIDEDVLVVDESDNVILTNVLGSESEAQAISEYNNIEVIEVEPSKLEILTESTYTSNTLEVDGIDYHISIDIFNEGYTVETAEGESYELYEYIETDEEMKKAIKNLI